MTNLISVIIPTYNRAHLLQNAIQSVLNQTYTNWELIIVDDGSTDNTKEVVGAYIQKEPRIRYFYKENGGQATARNLGIEKAMGDLFGFLDSDDVYMPRNLEKKLSKLKENEKCLIVNGFSWVVNQESGSFLDCTAYSPSNWLVKKEFLVLGEYFDSLQRSVEDAGTRIRAFIKGGKNIEVFLKEPQVIYFQHKDQVSNTRTSDPNIFIPRLEGLLKDFHGDGVEGVRDMEAQIYSRLGNFYCLSGNFRSGRKNFIKSLKSKCTTFSLFFLVISFSLNKYMYQLVENSLRFIQRRVMWKIRLLAYKKKFPVSYNEAIKILNNEKFSN